MRAKTVAAAVSGGVDSAVAALLLRRRGFDVMGVFMKNWDEADETGACSGERDFADAQRVCATIGVPLVRVDFVRRYWTEVFCALVDEYARGLTPNPDVLCNRAVKFDALFAHCTGALRADALATGHYAASSFGAFLERYDESAACRLLRPRDHTKDQTLFLSQVPQRALRRTMFPLGALQKSQVRQIARENGLTNVADKKDSYGICFVGKRDFKHFISQYIEDKVGDFIDIGTGKKVGVHRGVHQWTQGQRCMIGGLPKAYFVAKRDVQSNVIYVAPGSDHPSLHGDILITGKPHWICEEPLPLRENYVLNCYFRFQHIHPLVKCKVVKSKDSLIIKLDKSARAISPGQYAVLYSEDECFGSAQILHLGPSYFFARPENYR